jgi:folate-dependent phosphoribosylglycinamide formyltransferase PurN
MTKVVLMTSNGLRHRYAAKVIASELDLCGVVSEGKSSLTAHLTEPTIQQSRVIERHFADRNEAEKNLLGNIDDFPRDVNVFTVENGSSNDPDVFTWVKNLQPDVVLLYGTSIIKPPLLSYYEGHIINLHLGLSPYYRGSGTNFWPLVDGLPECVGATIHLATLTVDGGDILCQVRPNDVEPEDRAHELGTKVIMAAIKKMCKVVSCVLESKISPVKQDLTNGMVYRRRDFNSDAVEKMWRNFEKGMMEKYLSEKDNRDNRYPIVNFSNFDHEHV